MQLLWFCRGQRKPRGYSSNVYERTGYWIDKNKTVKKKRTLSWSLGCVRSTVLVQRSWLNQRPQHKIFLSSSLPTRNYIRNAVVNTRIPLEHDILEIYLKIIRSCGSLIVGQMFFFLFFADCRSLTRNRIVATVCGDAFHELYLSNVTTTRDFNFNKKRMNQYNYNEKGREGMKKEEY